MSEGINPRKGETKVKIVRCTGCRGSRTISAMGMMGKRPCPVCDGKGFEKVYEDPIRELEKAEPAKEETIIENKVADKAKKKK